MKTVIIMRGIPGSGKSTYARSMFSDDSVCSADDYFLSIKDGDVSYRFRPEQLPDAHGFCQGMFKIYLHRGDERIVVDNTNILVRHMQFYVDLALENGYDVKVIRLEAHPQVAAARNVHHVPEKTIYRHFNTIEPYAGETVLYPVEGVFHGWSEAA